MKTKTLLLSLLIICTFYNCSSTKNPKVSTEKFTNSPKIKGKHDAYKIDKTFNQKQRVLAFLRQQGDFKIEEQNSPELITITNTYGINGMNGVVRQSPLVFLNGQEILNAYSNSLNRIQNMFLSQFDEIFISRGGMIREIHLYTKKN